MTKESKPGLMSEDFLKQEALLMKAQKLFKLSSCYGHVNRRFERSSRTTASRQMSRRDATDVS